MGPTDSFMEVFRKYADFKGRARRSEYWYFTLFNAIIVCILCCLDFSIIGSLILYPLYLLVSFIPSLAVLARRLHDGNRSAWWFFIGLVPLVGGFILLYFLVQDSHPTTNQWGLNPKDPYAGVDDIADHLVE